MPNKNSDFLDTAFEYWQKDQPLEAGRLIFEHLPTEVRPKWAINILQVVVRRTGVKSPPIENILRIAQHPNEWQTAHEAFTLTRRFGLQLDKSPLGDTLLLQYLLSLAELVAKVIYNSTDPADEFDDDIGWYIAVNLKDIIDLLGHKEFSESMRVELCGLHD